jgi:hypothetical protein
MLVRLLADVIAVGLGWRKRRRLRIRAGHTRGGRAGQGLQVRAVGWDDVRRREAAHGYVQAFARTAQWQLVQAIRFDP